jgi:replicative DNA helicase
MTANEQTSNFQPPYSQEAEEALIGAVIVNGHSFAELTEQVSADDFFLVRNKHIWEAFTRIYEAQIEIDYLTVTDALKAANHLDGVGGESYIIGMFRNTPTSTHARTYAALVHRAAVRRRLMTLADELKGFALNENVSTEAVIEKAEKDIAALGVHLSPPTTVSMREASANLYDLVETRQNDKTNGTLGVPTGYHDLDDVLDGFTSGLHVIGARPGMGKTSLQLCMALASARLNIPTFFSSMEMEETEILIRLYSMETGIDGRLLRRGALNDRQFQVFVQSMGKLGGIPLFIDDSKGLSPQAFRSKILQTQRRHRVSIGIAFADGIYKMRAGKALAGERRMNDRREETGYICSRLKDMTGKRELGIPIVASHQLSRAVESRQDKRPVLSDLRESGDIEQEADSVMFIYRDGYYNEASEFPNQADIIIAKQRAGATGTVSLYFNKSITKFENAAVRNIDFKTMTVTDRSNGYHGEDNDE